MRRFTRPMRLTRAYVPVLILALVAAVVAAVLVATGGLGPAKAQVSSVASQAEVADTQAASERIQTIISHADFTVKYSSLAQLNKAAEVVVRGEIEEVSYVDFNTTAYTRTTLKVSECLKGDIKAGQDITIAEIGGITTMATVKGDKFGEPTAADRATKVRVLLEGAPLSEVGEKCLYFLGSGEIGVFRDAYYVPLGAFQGSFKIRNGLAERFVPADWAGTYSSLSTPEGGLDQAVLRDALGD